MTNQRRRFTKRQKIDLYLASGGLCEICQQPLPAVFHADHIKPYSKGGVTDVINGQATCPKCNLRKGDKDMSDVNYKFPLPEKFSPREWQREFFDSYTRQCIIGQDANFLLEACPAAGKTFASCAIANALLKKKLIDWVIVIVPTDHLRNQFAYDAKEFNIELDHSAKHLSENLTNSGDYQGEVLTYAQMGSNPGLYRIRCSRKNGKVLVIGDEIHHLSDNNSWGNAFQESFKNVEYRLFTSGTPFRSDKQKILSDWIDYEDGFAKADYTYDYAKALKDGVVRNVIFPLYDGDFTWMRNGNIRTMSFNETETKQEESDALKTALLANGGWMRETLESAHKELLSIRSSRGHIDAGGLLVCMNKVHAEECAKTLEEITGEKPIVVHSDDKESSKKIKHFGKEKGRNASKWIIAIKMISEGVSIKRLRVAVYATNILTLMFFLQLMGRITRIIGDYEDETAHLYAPSHPTLSVYVKEIESVVSKWQEADDDFEKSDKQNRQNKGFEDLPLFSSVPIASTGELDAQYLRGDKILPEELEKVHEIKKNAQLPDSLPDAYLAKFWRATISNTENNTNENREDKKSSKSNTTKTERCQKLRRDISGKARYLAVLCGANKDNQGQIISLIHNKANEVTLKGKPQDKATEEELENKLQFM